MADPTAVTKQFSFGDVAGSNEERLKTELAASEERGRLMRIGLEDMYDRLARGDLVSFEVGAERPAMMVQKPKRLRRKGGS